MRIPLRQFQKQLISFAGAILKESSLKLYKDDDWRKFGTLIKGRYWHGSIALGDEINGIETVKYILYSLIQ